MTEDMALSKRTERGVLSAVTLSHLGQHFLVGVSVLYADMMLDLNLSYTQLGIALGAGSIASGFLQIFWSRLSRSFSKRMLLGLGNVTMSIGTLAVATAQRLVHLIGGQVVTATGQAAQHPVAASIISQKFPRERIPGALSIHYGLGFVGNMVSPVVLSAIALSYGWRVATLLLSVLPLVTGVSLLYYLRGEASASRSIEEREAANLWADLKSVARRKDVVLIVAAQSLAVGGTGMGVIITYTPLYLRQALHLESMETSIIYSIAVIGGVAGTLLVGRIADRFGSLITAIFVMSAGSLLIALLVVHASLSSLLVLHLLAVAATSFSFGSLLQAHLASASTPRERDLVFGLYFTISQGVSSVWTTLTGFLIDTYGSFNPAWMFRAILGFMACLLLLLAYVNFRRSEQAEQLRE